MYQVAQQVDFVLPSDFIIPHAIWVATSVMITNVIKGCWALLGPCMIIKMLYDAISDLGNEYFSVRKQVRTLLQAMCLVVLLAHYKPILMFFDNFIDVLCLRDVIIFSKETNITALEGVTRNVSSSLLLYCISPFMALINLVVPSLSALLAYFSHKGVIFVMRYMRMIMLIVLAQVGPLAAILSLLPGPFKNSFRLWLGSYVNVSCWAITLRVFWHLTDVLAYLFATGDCFAVDTGFVPIRVFMSTTFSIMLLVAIFYTPSITSKFVNAVTIPSLLSGLGGLISTAIMPSRLVQAYKKIL